jgi:hypothetical protein
VRVLDAYKLQCIAEAQEGMMEQDKPLISTRAKLTSLMTFLGSARTCSPLKLFYFF